MQLYHVSILGLFQAVILNSPVVKMKKVFRTVFILPWAIPAMISLLVFKNVFNTEFGPLNHFLLGHHIVNEPVKWLIDPLIAKIVVITVNLWLGFPYFMALMTGVMTSIPKELYEACDIDGANAFDKFKNITFPLVYRATAPLLVLSFSGNFNNFGAVFFLTGGAPANPHYQYAGHTDILITWIYKLTYDFRMYNIASVASIFIFLIVGSITVYNFSRTSIFKDAR